MANAEQPGSIMNVTRPTPAHFGIYVFDLDRMVDFYTSVFRLTITDWARTSATAWSS
jgi:predicted enzyme related to lactoylglutathione lyase